MRLPDQHLSADEFESLGKEGGLSGELGDQLRLAREHAESCPACRRRLEVYPTSGTKLEKLRAPQGAKKGTDCPSMEIWLQLAGGLLPSAEQGRYTKHAATCDHCGPVLREITKDFSDTVSEDEKSALLDLNLHNQKWMKSLLSPSVPATQAEASPVIVKSTRRHARWFGISAWQGSAAALILVGVVVFSLFKIGVFTNKEDTIAKVNQLLAQAYTEQRTIELRIAGAAYGPVRVQRGTESANLPKQLYEAELIISRSEYAQTPSLINAQARVDLLRWNFESALGELDRALLLKPNDSGLLLDRATALYERAKENKLGSINDLSEAVELLSRVLKSNPNEAVALFNRAIVFEELRRTHEAILDCEHYLLIDPTGSWAREVRNRIERLKRLEQTSKGGCAFREQVRELCTSRTSRVPDSFSWHWVLSL